MAQILKRKQVAFSAEPMDAFLLGQVSAWTHLAVASDGWDCNYGAPSALAL